MNALPTVGPDKILKAGTHLSLVRRNFRGRDGNVAPYEIAVRNRSNGIVAGLPVTSDESYVLLSQYRIPLERSVIENVAGLVDEGETPEEAMRRELLEETGYSGGAVIPAFKMPTSSGLTNELVDCFVVRGVRKTAEPTPENAEAIQVVTVADGDFDRFLKTCYELGRLVDPKVPALVDYYRRFVRDRLG